MFSMLLLSVYYSIFISVIASSPSGISSNFYSHSFNNADRRKLTSTGGWSQGLVPNGSVVDLVGSACSATVCTMVGIRSSTLTVTAIFRTTNLGQSWSMPLYQSASTVVPSFYDIATAPPITSTSSSSSTPLLSSFFVAVTDKGPVYVSSNAGASFKLSTALFAKLRGVTIGANGVGIAVGSRNVSAFGPAIFRSTNYSAYATWQAATLSNPIGLSYPAAAQLWAVKSYNGQTAIAVGSYSTIFRSQDQGRTWVYNGDGAALCGSAAGNILFGVSIAEANADGVSVAIAGGNGNCLLKSADSGATWKKLNLTSTSSTKTTLSFNFHSVHVVSSNIMYVGASDGKIYRSLNGGSSWTVDYGINTKPVFTLTMIDFQRGVMGTSLDTGSQNIFARFPDPTQAPTGQPSSDPSRQPSKQPTARPTSNPSEQPTERPSDQPNQKPSIRPTGQPNSNPSRQPLTRPSSRPSRQPVRWPTVDPSAQPSSLPTKRPSHSPTRQPAQTPTRRPTLQPVSMPTRQPLCVPVVRPSGQPSRSPSGSPSSQPTRWPVCRPSVQPTKQPGSKPSVQPVHWPSSQPSRQPKHMPSGRPSLRPSSQPSDKPSFSPLSSIPTSRPTGYEYPGNWAQVSDVLAAYSDSPSSFYFIAAAWSSQREVVMAGGSLVNSASSLLHSSSSGQQWTELLTADSNTGAFFQDVAYWNSVFLAVDTAGYVYTLKSTGEYVVTLIAKIEASTQALNAVAFDRWLNLAVAVGGSNIVFSTEQSAYLTWSNMNYSTVRSTVLQSQLGLYSVAVISSGHMVVTGGSKTICNCYYTIVGDLTCYKVPSANINAGVTMTSNIFFGVSSVSSRMTVLSGNSGETLKSTNNGQTWTNLTLNTGSRGLFGKVVFPHTEAVVFAVDSRGRIFRSIDAGRSFSKETTVGEADRFPLWFVNAYSSSQMVVGGNIGNIYLKLPVPSQGPSSQPSLRPSRQPDLTPTSQPTLQPVARKPSVQPSRQPNRLPTSQPSRQPDIGKPSRQPNRVPTGQPSRQPRNRPSSLPSDQPTAQPSMHPTDQPTRLPTFQPSSRPTLFPSMQPSKVPSNQPSTQPRVRPTRTPSRQPTIRPSRQPVARPSFNPTSQPQGNLPSHCPSSQPNRMPSSLPSHQPSGQPDRSPSTVPSSIPSVQPVRLPTIQPSRLPSRIPSTQPSRQPNRNPTAQPSRQPVRRPTKQPTRCPTRQPNRAPSTQPTVQPRKRPSTQPTYEPTCQPNMLPSVQPSHVPSGVPTNQPGLYPSVDPTCQPASYPTKQPLLSPSTQPSRQPIDLPSWRPTNQPSWQPIRSPTEQPTEQPIVIPSAVPQRNPSNQPSRQPRVGRPTRQPNLVRPSRQPSARPSRIPSRQPMRRPTSQPQLRPSRCPTSQPSRQPSKQPLQRPVCQPTAQPSVQPIRKPSRQPSRQPIRRPSSQPVRSPSEQPTREPTQRPYSRPSRQPSCQPTRQPNRKPSCQPTRQPICKPSRQPNLRPTRIPSGQPNLLIPSSLPTEQPALSPSQTPSIQPSQNPSSRPTEQPTADPIVKPSGCPSRTPTSQPRAGRPSRQPVRFPTGQPARRPSRQPSLQPSTQPSRKPYRNPTGQPTLTPLLKPSKQPVRLPSNQPTRSPFRKPSRQPTLCPSIQPSLEPTAQPFSAPSALPSTQPWTRPTKQPLFRPTGQPIRGPSAQPSTQPKQKPSRQPMKAPTSQPTLRPRRSPTCQPSRDPSKQPSKQPLLRPTWQPTLQPVITPSRQPTSQPILLPSSQPISIPSTQPSKEPVSAPTRQPNLKPSGQPSRQPNPKPSSQPSRQPNTRPSRRPSLQPNLSPTRLPSNQPKACPSRRPISRPTGIPSTQPICRPTLQPGSKPSFPPSSQPSRQPNLVKPSTQPMRRPSSKPSKVPLSHPSRQPNSRPSRQPALSPTIQPRIQPSQQPRRGPSRQPSRQPNRTPSTQPGGRPSKQPTRQPNRDPSRQPSKQPVNLPSIQPSSYPSTSSPTSQPTRKPNGVPSQLPNPNPTKQPTKQPRRSPSGQPDRVPTRGPTRQPSLQPNRIPSRQPTLQPFRRSPSGQPTLRPDGRPTRQPSRDPTGQLTYYPTSQPSRSPTSQPGIVPTVGPSSQPIASPPTGQPSRKPRSSLPSCQPTRSPSSQPANRPSAFPTATLLQRLAFNVTQIIREATLEPTGVATLTLTFKSALLAFLDLPSLGYDDLKVVRLENYQQGGSSSNFALFNAIRIPSNLRSGYHRSRPDLSASSGNGGGVVIVYSVSFLVGKTFKTSSQGFNTMSAKILSLQTSSKTQVFNGLLTTYTAIYNSSSLKGSFIQNTDPVVIGDLSYPIIIRSPRPSSQPSTQPSSQPRKRPSTQPTRQPFRFPSQQPLFRPTCQPSSHPTQDMVGVFQQKMLRLQAAYIAQRYLTTYYYHMVVNNLTYFSDCERWNNFNFNLKTQLSGKSATAIRFIQSTSGNMSARPNLISCEKPDTAQEIVSLLSSANGEGKTLPKSVTCGSHKWTIKDCRSGRAICVDCPDPCVAVAPLYSVNPCGTMSIGSGLDGVISFITIDFLNDSTAYTTVLYSFITIFFLGFIPFLVVKVRYEEKKKKKTGGNNKVGDYPDPAPTPSPIYPEDSTFSEHNPIYPGNTLMKRPDTPPNVNSAAILKGSYFSDLLSSSRPYKVMSARWALLCRDSVLLRPIFSMLSTVYRKRPRHPDPPTTPPPPSANSNLTSSTPTLAMPLSQEFLQLLTRVVTVVFVFSALLFSALAHDDGLCALRVSEDDCKRDDYFLRTYAVRRCSWVGASTLPRSGLPEIRCLWSDSNVSPSLYCGLWLLSLVLSLPLRILLSSETMLSIAYSAHPALACLKVRAWLVTRRLLGDLFPPDESPARPSTGRRIEPEPVGGMADSMGMYGYGDRDHQQPITPMDSIRILVGDKRDSTSVFPFNGTASANTFRHLQLPPSHQQYNPNLTLTADRSFYNRQSVSPSTTLNVSHIDILPMYTPPPPSDMKMVQSASPLPSSFSPAKVDPYPSPATLTYISSLSRQVVQVAVTRAVRNVLGDRHSSGVSFQSPFLSDNTAMVYPTPVRNHSPSLNLSPNARRPVIASPYPHYEAFITNLLKHRSALYGEDLILFDQQWRVSEPNRAIFCPLVSQDSRTDSNQVVAVKIDRAVQDIKREANLTLAYLRLSTENTTMSREIQFNVTTILETVFFLDRLGHSFFSVDSLIFKRLIRRNLLLRNFQSFGKAKTIVSAVLCIIDILLIFGCVYLSRFKSSNFHISWVIGTVCLLIFDLLILDFYENSWFNIIGPFLIDRAVQEAAFKWTEMASIPQQGQSDFNIWDYFSLSKLIVAGLGSQVSQLVPESNRIPLAVHDTLPTAFIAQALGRTIPTTPPSTSINSNTRSVDMEQPNPTGEDHTDDNEKGEIIRPEVLFLQRVLLDEVRLLRVVCAYLPLPMQQLLHSLFLILVVEIGFQCSELIRSGYLAAGVVLYIIYASLLLVFISQGIYIMRLPRKSVVTESGGMQKIVVSQPRNLPTAGDDDDVDDDDGSKSDKVRATAMVVMVTAQTPPPPLADSSDDQGDQRMDFSIIATSSSSIVEKEKSTTPNTVTNAYHLSDSESDSEDFENLRRFFVDDDEEESSLEGWGPGEGEGEEGDWQSLLSSSTLEKDDDDDEEEEEDDEDEEEDDDDDVDDDDDEYMKQENDVDDVAIADIEVDVDLEQQQQQKKDQKKGRKVRHAEESKFYT